MFKTAGTVCSCLPTGGAADLVTTTGYQTIDTATTICATTTGDLEPSFATYKAACALIPSTSVAGCAN